MLLLSDKNEFAAYQILWGGGISNNGRLRCTVSYWIIRNWKVIQVQGHIFQIADVEVGVTPAPAAGLYNIWSSALEPNNRYPLWYKLISEPGHPSAAVARVLAHWYY